MKRIQGRRIVGTVVVEIVGEHLLTLLQYLRVENIAIWNVRFITEKQLQFEILYHHEAKLIHYCKQANLQIRRIKKVGMVFSIQKLWRQKEKLLAIVFVLLALFILTNTLWQIRIEGISAEMEQKLLQRLAEEGIERGAFLFFMPNMKEVETELLYDFPELIFLSLEQRGTTLNVRAVEKIAATIPETKTNQHLIARKSGVVQKLLIKEGQAAVDIYDHVQKGQLLVSGIWRKGNEQENDDSEVEEMIVGAEGKVFASTAYELTIESSLEKYYVKLIKPLKTLYFIRFQGNDVTIPLWGAFWKHGENEKKIEMTTKLSLFQKEIPFTFVKVYYFTENEIVEQLSVEAVKRQALEKALRQFAQQLGKDAEIEKYYILHESVHNGKVRLRLYIRALENIAVGAPIQ